MKEKYVEVQKLNADDTYTISNLNVELHNATNTVEATKQSVVTRAATHQGTVDDLTAHVENNAELIEVIQNEKSRLHQVNTN